MIRLSYSWQGCQREEDAQDQIPCQEHLYPLALPRDQLFAGKPEGLALSEPGSHVPCLS